MVHKNQSDRFFKFHWTPVLLVPALVFLSGCSLVLDLAKLKKVDLTADESSPAPGLELTTKVPVALSAVIPTVVTGPFEATISFGASTSAFKITDLALSNAVASDLAGGPSEYSVRINPIADGNFSVRLLEGSIINDSGMTNEGSNEILGVFDRPATVSFGSVLSGVVSGSFSISVNFSKPVTGLTLSDFQVTNGIATGLIGGGPSYVATISPTTVTTGLITVSLPSGAAKDSQNVDSEASVVVTRSFILAKQFMSLPLGHPSFNRIPSGNIRSIYKDTGTGRLYINTDNSTAYSLDGGFTWKAITALDGVFTHYDHYTMCVAGPIVYIGSYAQTYKSTDSGTTFKSKVGDWIDTSIACSTNGFFAVGNGMRLSIDAQGGFPAGVYNSSNGLPANGVTSLFYIPGSPGILFVGTTNGLAVTSNNGTTFSVFKNPTVNMLSNSIRKVYVDSGKWYIGSNLGLSISSDNGATWSNYTTAQGLVNNSVRDVVAKGNAIYVATDGGLSVSSNSGSTWTSFTIAQGLVSNSLQSLFIESPTQWYVGTTSGFSFTSNGGSLWVNANPINMLPSQTVADVAIVDPGSIIWAATPAGAAFSTDGGLNWTTKTTSQGIAHNNVRDIRVDGGKLFLGTGGGLSVSSDGGSTWSNYTTAQGLINNNIQDLWIDNEKIYVATSGGLSISSNGGGNWSNFTTGQGLVSNNIVTVSADQNTICVGTDSGFSLSLNGGVSWVNSTSGAGTLSHNDVRQVWCKGAKILVATFSGLNVSDDLWVTRRTFGTSNGLDWNLVGYVTQLNNTVFATNLGVAMSIDGAFSFLNFNQTSLTAGGDFTGLIGNPRGITADSSGRLYMSGIGILKEL